MRDKGLSQQKRIGLQLFEGITALDVAGPMEAFAGARLPRECNTTPCYELNTIGLNLTYPVSRCHRGHGGRPLSERSSHGPLKRSPDRETFCRQ